MHAYWQLAGAALALLLYWLLIKDVIRGILRQSLTTWGLWSVLDLITLISILEKKGNWLILAIYIVGSLAICLSLAYKKQFAWTWFKTFIVTLVGVCLLVWYYLGSTATTVAGTTSVALATLPQLKDSWLTPNRKSVRIWAGFLVVNIFFFLGGTTWEVKEVLYPLVCVGLCTALTIINRR